MSPLADVEKLVIEGRYGRADLALRRLEALIPGLAPASDTETLLLALYGRALLLRQLKAGTQNEIAACDVLERAAHEREAELWVATACATRARFRVDSGDIGGATADLARADAEAATGDLTNDTGYRLLDGLSLVYSSLRLHDRADEMRSRIEHSIGDRRVLDQAQHWATWSGELAARAMEPLALGGEVQDPQLELMARAIEIAAKLDGLPEKDVPSTLRRGARGVRALSAAYRGRPSEALRLLGPDAFGTVADLPLVERQIVSLAAMRAHALVGSLATARSLDDAAADTAPTTLPNLVLEVCRTRERLWLETYAGGDVIPVLHRMTELLVRLGWRGMDLLADTARQALEHQALRTESRTDALTGVGNRRALDEELRQLLRFGPLPLSLILVDIDHFKGVNDVFTHVVGDEVLKRVAASLSLQLRTDDQLLRYGGDEFVVLLPGTGDEEADAVAERMRAAVAARPWSELAEGLQVSITTGVAAVWSLSGRRPDADAEKLFRRADERLLEGKRNRPEGGGRVRTEPAALTATAEHSNRTALTGPAPATDRDQNRFTPNDRPGPDQRSGSDQAAPDERADWAANGLFPAARAIGAGPVVSLAAKAGSHSDWPGSEDESPAYPAKSAPWSSRSQAADPDDEAHDESDVDEPLPAAPAAWQLPTSTPARSRNRSAASSERGPRSAFDPGPEEEEERARASESAPPRPGGRRDTRPRAIESSNLPAVAPIRSRREARAANRPDVDALHETSASRDAAEADAAAREVSKAQADEVRLRIARESQAREDAARDAELRAEQEKADREAEAQERMAQEWLARDRAARDQALRQQAEAEAREQEAREQAQRRIEAEAEAREKAAREQAERQAAEAEARERAARERAAQEKAAREAAEQAAREAAETAARLAAEKAAREAAEAAAREAAEQAAREAAELERRRAAERARAERERREAEARERERRELAAQAERERREAEARERERHEAAVKAERERREAENRARAERERVVRERLEQERLLKERQERERVEREQREAAAREAERVRQEARERVAAEARERAAALQRAEAEAEARVVAIEQARIRAEAEAERARAADRIREEAYARDVENARRAAGSNQGLTSLPSFDQGAYQNGEPTTAPIAAVRPLQRRSPLYDASSRSEEVEPFRERRSHPRPGSSPRTGLPSGLNAIGPGPKAPNGKGKDVDPDQDSPDTIALRTRRDQPFGPPTRSQAIIDLSARKRPRSPYKGDR